MGDPAIQTRRHTQFDLAHQVSRELGRDRAPSPEVADNDLIRRTLEGDFAAFEGLVARHERRAFWIAFQVLGNVEESRDAIQDAFVRVYRSLDRFDFARNFYTWFFRIVTNLAIDRRRKRKLAVAAQPEDTFQSLADDDARSQPDARLQERERAALVHRVLAGIPEMFRTVLVLRDLQGLSCREIAPITGLTYSTVRWRLHKARGLFRERWERESRRSAS